MARKYRNVLSRRTMLRGAGTVAISLPFLDEMMTTSAFAALPDPPARAFNLFFGLGVPKEMAAEGLVNGLAPLAAVADKLTIVRGINQYESDGPENNHFDGAGACFTGREPVNVSQCSGPSVDQVILNELYPEGPDTLINTLMMGSFFRRKLEANESLTRFVHCWREDGAPVDVPIETPALLFQRIFGKGPVGDGPDDIKAQHYERSVLDNVLGQYEHYQSAASGLGGSSRAKIADHLEKIREMEKKLFPEGYSCEVPMAPGDLPLLHGQDVDGGGGGPDLDINEWTTHWQLMADLYALAVQCDVTRFGMVMFQSAGERIRLMGDYDYNGTTVTFDDPNDPISSGGSHEYWHAYPAGNPAPQMQWHTHYIMSQLVYFMQQLDNPAYLDENGQTILDNALLTIGTELGNG
ncbi:MAG: DUF1552 domain-containing protein, partial [Myxococcota bacterium]